MSNAMYQHSRAADLSRFDNDFRAEPLGERPEFTPLPDGRYQAVIERVDLTQSQASGNPRLYWVLRIVGPNHQGKVIGKGQTITANSLKWVKQELHVCGVDPEPFSDLPNLLENMTGTELEITKKTRDGFENIYIEKRLNGAA